MLTTNTRRGQFAIYSVCTYVATVWSVYSCIESSRSFLEATLKLCEGINLVIIGNFVLVNGVLLWNGLTRLLFGELRLIEYEHIFERLSFTIVNSIFVSSMFKEQDFVTVVFFTAILIFTKVFHWILKDRLEYVFQTTNDDTTVSDLLRSKFFINMIVLALVDIQIVRYCLNNSMAWNSHQPASPSVYLMFGIEFSTLLVDVVNVALHGVINLVELHTYNQAREADVDEFTGLEGKFMYQKIVDIITRFAKMLFHIVLLIPFQMPVMIVKDVIWDIVALFQSIKSVWKTWKNNRQLDQKLPDVTEGQLEATENKMCIVCMDDMLPPQEAQVSNQKPKRLPCGHFLHLGCLKSWMERSQTCPICRLPVFDEQGNVYAQPTTPESAQRENPATSNDQNTNPVPRASNEGTEGDVSSSDNAPVLVNIELPSDWYPFPREASSDNSELTFKLTDLDGKEMQARLRVSDTPDIPNEDESGATHTIVIHESDIEQRQEIETMKRKISELESKVEELTKRARNE
ncbi:LAFE_0E01420g1_1 [Lachancea fermentati]|uniref:RING-type E3 ubiquitin transferase n=1 Tax=Lachancea fermentati TaxID=4955 RepID=A0A1G4MCB3_LACFM|nr:LAFE_0E01420g1_1 [Lachancea fermentati]